MANESVLEFGHGRVVDEYGGWQDIGGSAGGVTRRVLDGFSPRDIIL